MPARIAQRLLLIGNGVNLIAKNHQGTSYKSLLKNAIVAKSMTVSEKAEVEELDRLLSAYAEAHPEDDAYASIYSDLSGMCPTHAHHLLATLAPDFFRILTLNYDSAMEKALQLRMPRVKESPLEKVPCLGRAKVCHIHGMLNSASVQDSNCVLSPASYRTALKLFPVRLPEQFWVKECSIDTPWYQAFITHEVHICGASLYDSELLLWRAFELRKQWIDSLVAQQRWQNRIFVYLFQQRKDKTKVEKLACRLKKLAVEPIIIPVHGSMQSQPDFNAAWERLVGKLVFHLRNVHVYHDSLQHLPLGKTANVRTRKRNVSIARVADLKFPELCVVYVPYGKLNSAELHDKCWLFYCCVDAHLYYWRVHTRVLQSIASSQLQDEKKKRFSIYLNFKTGELLNMLTLHSCATCTKCSPKKFDSLILTLKNS